MNNKVMSPKTPIHAINSLTWNWEVSELQGVKVHWTFKNLALQQNHLGSFWTMQPLEPHPRLIGSVFPQADTQNSTFIKSSSHMNSCHIFQSKRFLNWNDGISYGSQLWTTWDTRTSSITVTGSSCLFPSSRYFLCLGSYLFIYWKK